MYLDTSDFVNRYMTLAAYVSERTGFCCTVYVYADMTVYFKVGDTTTLDGPYEDVSIVPDYALADVVCVLANATDNNNYIVETMFDGFDAMDRGYRVDF